MNSLPNGIKVITSNIRGTRTATVLIIVATGSKYENQKNSGISHFLEHMFFKGTKNRTTALAISSELDSIGAEFNAFTGKEYTGYWVKVDVEKIEKAVSILSDMLLNSLFSIEEIERERGVIIEEYNMYADNPMMHIEDVFENCLYGNTPAGWDTIGTKEVIKKVKRSDFVSYFESQYGPKNINICVAGNIKNEEKIIPLLKKYFQSTDFNKRGSGFKEKIKVIETQKKPQILVESKKTDQAHFSMGVRSFGYLSSEKIILKIISIILGGSMSSRLFVNLRERNGLAYYVRTDSEIYTDSGYLTTRAGVPVEKLDQAIEIVLQEYRKLKKEKINHEELQRAKDMIAGRMAIQMESSDNVANWLGRQAALTMTIKRKDKKIIDNHDIKTTDDYLHEIKSIKSEDIQRVAQQIFIDQNLNLAVIGPYKNKNKFIKILKL